MNRLSWKTVNFIDPIAAHVASLARTQSDPSLASEFRHKVKALVDSFNEHELKNWPLTQGDYLCHTLAHLIDDCDTINASFTL